MGLSFWVNGYFFQLLQGKQVCHFHFYLPSHKRKNLLLYEQIKRVDLFLKDFIREEKKSQQLCSFVKMQIWQKNKEVYWYILYYTGDEKRMVVGNNCGIDSFHSPQKHPFWPFFRTASARFNEAVLSEIMASSCESLPNHLDPISYPQLYRIKSNIQKVIVWS